MIYLIENLETGQIKIGRSLNPHKRVKQLQTGSCHKLNLVRIYDVESDLSVERRLHSMLWESRKRGEWFYFPSHEYVAFIDELLGDYRIFPKAVNTADSFLKVVSPGTQTDHPIGQEVVSPGTRTDRPVV